MLCIATHKGDKPIRILFGIFNGTVNKSISPENSKFLSKGWLNNLCNFSHSPNILKPINNLKTCTKRDRTVKANSIPYVNREIILSKQVINAFHISLTEGTININIQTYAYKLVSSLRFQILKQFGLWMTISIVIIVQLAILTEKYHH